MTHEQDRAAYDQDCTEAVIRMRQPRCGAGPHPDPMNGRRRPERWRVIKPDGKQCDFLAGSQIAAYDYMVAEALTGSRSTMEACIAAAHDAGYKVEIVGASRTKTFQCEVNGNSGLTVVFPENPRDQIQFSVGAIGKMDTHKGVYLDPAMVRNLLTFLTANL